MLTPEQIKMREKLQYLTTENGRELEKIEGDYSDSQKLLKYLCQKYMEGKHQSDFCDATKVDKSTYQALIGNGKKEAREGIKGEGTLLKIVFGIGTTTEEAVLYFHYTGKNLLCDEPAMVKIFNILLRLNDLYGKSDAEKRMATLDELIGQYDLRLR